MKVEGYILADLCIAVVVADVVVAFETEAGEEDLGRRRSEKDDGLDELDENKHDELSFMYSCRC